MNDTADKLMEMLQEASKEITFKSEVLEKAPKMTKEQLQIEIDNRIDLVSNPIVNVEIKERVSKEARVMALMKLRQEI